MAAAAVAAGEDVEEKEVTEAKVATDVTTGRVEGEKAEES